VTAPGTLTAAALADAVAAVDATVVFASPAALRNVVDTFERSRKRSREHQRSRSREQQPLEPLEGVTLLISAGAPVPAALLRQARALLPKAQAHTPYGMTEVLPVTDVTLEEIEEAGTGEGICVGRPLPGVRVAVDGETGEIMVAAEHAKDRYDALWLTEDASSHRTAEAGWHRTGDVGHLDQSGRLWVEGRLVHVIDTAAGRLTPVGIEQRVETLPGVGRAAAVGVGPRGTQQLVVVAETGTTGLASVELLDAVRRVAGHPVAAVLTIRALPTDIRHNSKIDRREVARWATRMLAGDDSNNGDSGGVR
jgi:acyl-coenzyme A synthetase/AMP-(fatty) acid ligase